MFVTSIAAMSLMPLAVTGTNLAFPEIERTFDGSSRAVLSWALSGYSITIAAFTLLGGQLSDRFDARRVFLMGLAVFAAASAIAAVAPNEAVLIGGRALQGVGGALVVPASLVLVTSQYPPERHGLVIGVWTAAFPIGSALAPTVTTLVLQFASWRWVFLTMTIAAGLIAAVIAPLPIRLPERTEASSGRADYLGTVVGTAAVGLLALGIVQGPSWGWASGRTVGVLLVAAAMAPAFVWWSRRHPRPLLDLDLFRLRTFTVATIANVFISIAGMSVWLVWPLVMNNQWGYSQIEIGLAITPTPALAGTVSMITARVARERGYRPLLVSGSLVLVAANLFFLTALGSDPDYVGAMLPGLVLYGVGMGLTFAPVNAAALVDVEPEAYGQANAGFSTGRFLSGALGIAITIAALGDGEGDPFVGYDRAFLVLALMSAASLVTVSLMWPRQPRGAGIA